MAVGILAVGIMLVATVFPAAIYLTTVAAEKTMAAVIADGAFAKMKLFGIAYDNNDISPGDPFFVYSVRMIKKNKIDPNEFIYQVSGSPAQYSWDAVCNKFNDDPCDMRYIVKLFVARKTNLSLDYIAEVGPPVVFLNWPTPISVRVESDPNLSKRQLKISWSVFSQTINPPPSTVVVDADSGRLFRIVKRDNDILTLDRDWDSDLNPPNTIWFMPCGLTAAHDKFVGKNPDIDVYQEIIDFKKL